MGPRKIVTHPAHLFIDILYGSYIVICGNREDLTARKPTAVGNPPIATCQPGNVWNSFASN